MGLRERLLLGQHLMGRRQRFRTSPSALGTLLGPELRDAQSEPDK